MTYNEISKALFNAGYVDGFRNIRRKVCKGYRLIAAFSDSESIKEVYFSVQLGSSFESICSCVIPSLEYKEFEKALDEVTNRISVELTKFSENMVNILDDLKTNKTIKSWK